MKIFFLYYINISFLLCIDYAILYEDSLYEPANLIANLYSNELDASFQLNTEIYSKSYIENFNGASFSDKIKSFCLDLKDNNPELSYILILGDENSFPPIYTSNNIPSDDFYLQDTEIISNIPPQISIGRVPSSNLNEINNFAVKLHSFLTNPTIGSWRDKAILIADDEFKNGENEACEIKHTINSDIIYDILSDYMNVKTLYGVEYNSTTTSDGQFHSDLNEEIINEINEGIALINYIGHGDQTTLSAEKIIDMERDLAQISIAENKLGVWIVGTCKFGQYDNDICMAEKLITNEDASIGVISTVRSVSSNYNIDFLEYLFNEYTNHFNSRNVIRLGDLIKQAKNNSYNENPNFYQGYLFHLFGDPALPIFSSIQQPSEDILTNTINVGQSNNIDISDYDIGSLLINFDDYESLDYIYGEPSAPCDGELTYSIPGNNLFKAEFTDNSCYTIPLDAMNCSNCNAKVQLYYQNEGDYNGISFMRNNVTLQSDESMIDLSDVTGPEINFSRMNQLLYDNSVVLANSEITVNISDSSGINIYNGIAHNFRYWFNDESNSYNIQPSLFNYNNTCLGSGKLDLIIPDNYLGYNTIYFEAWDNFNNRSEKSINLKIIEPDSKNRIISDFLNLPNPFRENTHFTFQVSNPSYFPIYIEINIYNLDGELIKTLKNNNINQTFNSITWDGTNNSNKKIPNGSYIVQIIAKANNGTQQKEKHIITKIK